MKKVSKFTGVILLFVMVMISSSCKDSKGLGEFTASIAGESWSALAPTGVKTGNRITITGLSMDKQVILNVGGITTGTYNMAVLQGNIQALTYTPNVNMQGAQETYVGTEGSITVTNVSDGRITGTFNFTAANASMSVINVKGEFTDVKYF